MFLSARVYSSRHENRRKSSSKKARSSRDDKFCYSRDRKRNVGKARAAYRCQHANWRTRQQKSMTSLIHDDAALCSRKPVFVGGVTGFGEICTDIIRARAPERRGNLPPVDDLEANYVRIELGSIEPRFLGFYCFPARRRKNVTRVVRPRGK